MRQLPKAIPELDGGLFLPRPVVELLESAGLHAAPDRFARLWVMPQGGHGLSGNAYNVNGLGQPQPTTTIPNTIDRVGMMVDWVENGAAPPMHATLTAGARSLPLCSYPAYPRYQGGGLPTDQASSYDCAQE